MLAAAAARDDGEEEGGDEDEGDGSGSGSLEGGVAFFLFCFGFLRTVVWLFSISFLFFGIQQISRGASPEAARVGGGDRGGVDLDAEERRHGSWLGSKERERERERATCTLIR